MSFHIINDYESNIIIAQTNNSVHNYNQIIRNTIYTEAIDSVMKNERLLVTENNYNHSIHLMNGDFLEIKEIFDFGSQVGTFLDWASKKYNIIILYCTEPILHIHYTPL